MDSAHSPQWTWPSGASEGLRAGGVCKPRGAGPQEALAGQSLGLQGMNPKPRGPPSQPDGAEDTAAEFSWERALLERRELKGTRREAGRCPEPGLGCAGSGEPIAGAPRSGAAGAQRGRPAPPSPSAVTAAPPPPQASPDTCVSMTWTSAPARPARTAPSAWTGPAPTPACARKVGPWGRRGRGRGEGLPWGKAQEGQTQPAAFREQPP